MCSTLQTATLNFFCHIFAKWLNIARSLCSSSKAALILPGLVNVLSSDFLFTHHPLYSNIKKGSSVSQDLRGDVGNSSFSVVNTDHLFLTYFLSANQLLSHAKSGLRPFEGHYEKAFGNTTTLCKSVASYTYLVYSFRELIICKTWLFLL